MLFLTLDINECTENVHGCEGSCINTIGGYKCKCKEGFTLRGNLRTCKGMKYVHVHHSELHSSHYDI